MKQPKFIIGDRVKHDYLGKGTIQKEIRSSLDKRYIAAYIILVDKPPDVRYNGGIRECLVFPTDLRLLDEV